MKKYEYKVEPSHVETKIYKHFNDAQRLSDECYRLLNMCGRIRIEPLPKIFRREISNPLAEWESGFDNYT